MTMLMFLLNNPVFLFIEYSLDLNQISFLKTLYPDRN